jgi:hypothetical protein
MGAGGLTLAALLHLVRWQTLSAVEFDAEGCIRRVCFTGEKDQPQVDVGAPPVRAVHLGPASVGGDFRRRKPTGKSPCRHRGNSSGCARPSPAPDLAARLRFCPLLCGGQSLAWFVPIPVIFAEGASASTRRFVAGARRLRGFVWLARQCLARRRLALVVRGSLLLGRARARLRAVAGLRRLALARGFRALRRPPTPAELVDSLSSLTLAPFAPGPAPLVGERASTQASRCRDARVRAVEERRCAARSAEVDVWRAANHVAAPLASKILKRPASSSISLSSQSRRQRRSETSNPTPAPSHNEPPPNLSAPTPQTQLPNKHFSRAVVERVCASLLHIGFDVSQTSRCPCGRAPIPSPEAERVPNPSSEAERAHINSVPPLGDSSDSFCSACAVNFV